MDSAIEAVLRHYGAEYVPTSHGWKPMKCPFHSDGMERVSSASVSTEKNAFNCHACEAKGDAISLIKWKEGVDFAGASDLLAEIAGESYRPVRGKPRRVIRKPLSGEPRNYEGNPEEVSFRVRRKPAAGS